MTDEQKAELIEQAKNGIGAHDGNDWSLDPESHKDLLPNDGFAGLKNILAQTPVTNLMIEYLQFDKIAGKQQKLYRKKAKARIWLFFLALAIGAISLLPVEQMFGPRAVKIATFIQFSAIFMAVLLVIDGLRKQHYQAWRNARTTAELVRGRLFRSVINADASSSITEYWPIPQSDLPLALQKLEYVRRFHIELQYAYYLGRGEQHIESEKKGRKWLLWVVLMGFLASIPILVTGVHLIHENWGWLERLANWLPDMQASAGGEGAWYAKLFLALGTFAVGLEASITNITRINNDLANSTQYHETARRLEKLYKKWLRKVRWQAVDNDIAFVRRWFQQGNGLILEEHRKWGQQQSARLEPLSTVEDLEKSVG